MLLIHSQRTIFNNIDFGERGTEFLLQSVPTVSYKIVEKNDFLGNFFFFGFFFFFKSQKCYFLQFSLLYSISVFSVFICELVCRPMSFWNPAENSRSTCSASQICPQGYGRRISHIFPKFSPFLPNSFQILSFLIFIRSYLKTGETMSSTVLPWYPGGHVLSKMQGRHLDLQDRHGEGSQKKKHKAKNHKDCNPIKECCKKRAQKEKYKN